MESFNNFSFLISRKRHHEISFLAKQLNRLQGNLVSTHRNTHNVSVLLSTKSNINIVQKKGESCTYLFARPWCVSFTLFFRCKGSISILNQIPNATSNTFLNNSKSAECRLIPFKQWLCVRHLNVKFERSAWFHARAFAFCLMVPPFKKVTKRRQKIIFFNFVLLYANVLFLSFVGNLRL